MKSKSKMFSFITETWNPIAMHCPYGCYFGGCWAEALKQGRLKDTPRYRDLSQPKLIEKELNRAFKKGDYVFVEDMGDLFAPNVSETLIQQVLLTIWDDRNKDAKFLLLTKNPERMFVWEKNIPENCLCGSTIETTEPLGAISKAPATQNRYMAMRRLEHPHKMICIEPIIDFNSVKFQAWIEEIEPELIVIGYDNYNCHLPEPSLAKTMKFIEALKAKGFNVQTKTLREKES